MLKCLFLLTFVLGVTCSNELFSFETKEVEINDIKQIFTQINAMKKEMNSYKEKNIELEKKLHEVMVEMSILKKENAEIKFSRGFTQEGQNLQPPVKRLLIPEVTTISPTQQHVAFAAVLTHDVSLGELQPVEYDKVISNIGNAFDSRHGHFLAPVKGVYILCASILNAEGSTAFVEMVKNGVQLVAFYGDPDDYSMGSQTIVVSLEANDMIWIRHYFDSTPISLYGRQNQPINTFSGALLFQLN